MTLVISGFPGVGKTHYFLTESSKMIVDSDSSSYSWSRPGVRNPDFPNNYMEQITSLLGKCDVILVSSHKEVRDALVANGIRFTLVYPARILKEDYRARFLARGSDDAFVELLDTMWDVWITELQEQRHCDHIELKRDEYLSDVIRVVRVGPRVFELLTGAQEELHLWGDDGLQPAMVEVGKALAAMDPDHDDVHTFIEEDFYQMAAALRMPSDRAVKHFYEYLEKGINQLRYGSARGYVSPLQKTKWEKWRVGEVVLPTDPDGRGLLHSGGSK